jgi:hypothetical protein
MYNVLESGKKLLVPRRTEYETKLYLQTVLETDSLAPFNSRLNSKSKRRSLTYKCYQQTTVFIDSVTEDTR